MLFKHVAEILLKHVADIVQNQISSVLQKLPFTGDIYKPKMHRRTQTNKQRNHSFKAPFYIYQLSTSKGLLIQSNPDIKILVSTINITTLCISSQQPT